MMNPALDIAAWRERLAVLGRIQVPDILLPEAAGRLHQCLADEVPWTLAIRDRDGARTVEHARYRGMSAAEIEALLAGAADAAGQTGDAAFRFAYDSYMMVRAYQEGRDPGLLLHRVLELFNSPDYLAFARLLAGDPGIRRINAQATRYRRGHFLRYHTDIDSQEGRRFAYVLNLTRRWQADWGGLLQFIDGEGRIVDTFQPRWNSMSVFAVPTGHAVSLVAPWAEEERLAITGWWLG